MTLPIIMTADGAQPQAPADLRAQIVSTAIALSPGLTANLPASLVEDMSSTAAAAAALCDSAAVELINSITPYGANEFLLTQLGNIYGVPLGQPTNTSVYVTFTGTVGFVIAQGFIISDGTNQYRVVDGGIIGSSGSSSPLFCIATQTGSWPVPANTVTQLITSVPGAITLSCNNVTDGTPGNPDTESMDSYRARILQAEQSTAQGMTAALKKALMKVSGVQARLVSMVQQSGGGWSVICGGGDPYEVAYAIFMGLFDISSLVGSLTTGRNITVTINDYPNTYSVVFINPPLQTVDIALTWNTTATNFVANTAIQTLGAPAIVNYVNSLSVGQPMNLFDMQDAFRQAVSIAIPENLLTRMVFTVSINTVVTPPTSGTGIIAGDPESYFYTTIPQITITRG